MVHAPFSIIAYSFRSECQDKSTEPNRKHAGNQISKEKAKLSKLVITHLTPDIVETLAAVLKVVNRADDGLELVLTNPAEKVHHP